MPLIIGEIGGSFHSLKVLKSLKDDEKKKKLKKRF